MMLLAGCGGSDDGDASPAAKTSTSTSSEPTTSTSTTPPPQPSATPTPAGPLTQAEYQKKLTELDQRLAGDINALAKVRNEASLTEAIDNLSQTLTTESATVGAIQVPKRIGAANRVLQLRLKAAATTLSAAGTEDVSCGGLVYVSQAIQRQLTAVLAVPQTQLKTLGLSFGSSLPDLGPEPADVRPSNGDIVVRTGAAWFGPVAGQERHHSGRRGRRGQDRWRAEQAARADVRPGQEDRHHQPDRRRVQPLLQERQGLEPQAPSVQLGLQLQQVRPGLRQEPGLAGRPPAIRARQRPHQRRRPVLSLAAM